MNRGQVNMLLAATSIFTGGVLVGWTACRVKIEGKVREEYKVSQKAFQNAMRLASQTEPEAPVENEIDLFKDVPPPPVEKPDFSDIEVTDNQGTVIVSGEIEQTDNPYHKAVASTIIETPVEVFVDGGINDYGMSYIEEEDYLDEDGRLKLKIDIFMDDFQPRFMMDGQPCDDWDKRVGDSILVDFYNLVPPGAEPVLYVRNHRTDEDYEVVRVVP